MVEARTPSTFRGLTEGPPLGCPKMLPFRQDSVCFLAFNERFWKLQKALANTNEILILVISLLHPLLFMLINAHYADLLILVIVLYWLLILVIVLYWLLILVIVLCWLLILVIFMLTY